MRSTYSSGVVWPVARPDAKQVLVCLSFCGGSPAAFRPWVQAMPDHTDLALVCYPGRERRMAEQFAKTWDELLAVVVAAVQSVATRPYVLMGHSMGARLAFDATLHLEATGGSVPGGLVVSGSTSPLRAAAELRQSPRSADSDHALLDWMRRVGQLPEQIVDEPELRRMALDLFRADLRVAESYTYRAHAMVKTPMQVLYGRDDEKPGGHEWSEVAAGPFQYDELSGGHFYTPEIWSALPTFVRALSVQP